MFSFPCKVEKPTISGRCKFCCVISYGYRSHLSVINLEPGRANFDQVINPTPQLADRRENWKILFLVSSREKITMTTETFLLKTLKLSPNRYDNLSSVFLKEVYCLSYYLYNLKNLVVVR